MDRITEFCINEESRISAFVKRNEGQDRRVDELRAIAALLKGLIPESLSPATTAIDRHITRPAALHGTPWAKVKR